MTQVGKRELRVAVRRRSLRVTRTQKDRVLEQVLARQAVTANRLGAKIRL